MLLPPFDSAASGAGGSAAEGFSVGNSSAKTDRTGPVSQLRHKVWTKRRGTKQQGIGEICCVVNVDILEQDVLQYLYSLPSKSGQQHRSLGELQLAQTKAWSK